MNPISFVLSLILAIWIVLGSYVYTCVYQQLCEGWNWSSPPPAAEITIEKPTTDLPSLEVLYKSGIFMSAKDNFVFETQTNQLKVPENSKFVIDSLKNYLRKNPKKKIEITGYYLPTEENKSKFADLGLLRAEAVRKLLLEEKLKNQLVIRSEQKTEFVEKSKEIYDGLNLKIIDDTPEIKITQKEAEILSAKHVIYFATASTQMITSPETEEFFKLLQNYLKKSPNSKIRVSGHTDNVGTDKANFTFGKNRAENVRKQLIARGLPAGQIIAETKGMNEPIADNKTDAGKQKNRRVEIVFEK